MPCIFPLCVPCLLIPNNLAGYTSKCRPKVLVITLKGAFTNLQTRAIGSMLKPLIVQLDWVRFSMSLRKLYGIGHIGHLKNIFLHWLFSLLSLSFPNLLLWHKLSNKILILKYLSHSTLKAIGQKWY